MAPHCEENQYGSILVRIWDSLSIHAGNNIEPENQSNLWSVQFLIRLSVAKLWQLAIYLTNPDHLPSANLT